MCFTDILPIQAWASVTKAINEKYGLELVKQQIKSRLHTLKRKYTAVSAMLSASGFGWDSARNVVLVHDEVWDNYVKSHPRSIDYHRTSLPYYDELVKLFEGTYATGEHSITSDEPSLNEFVTGPNGVEANVTTAVAGPSSEASS